MKYILLQIVDAINRGEISSKQGKELFAKVLDEQDEPLNLIEKYGLKQLDNTSELEIIIENILNNNKNLIEDYHNGKTNIFGFFVGQVMKETNGQANPVLVKQLLIEKLK